MKMKCSIIQDLLPSYIDGICSPDTTELVKEHLQDCKVCKDALKRMEQKKPVVLLSEEDIIKAKKPFQVIRKEKVTQIIAAVLATILLVIICGSIYLNVSWVNDLFTPKMGARINAETATTDWENLGLSKGSKFKSIEYLEFDNVFYKKEIINDGNSKGDVILRIKDVDGNVVLDNLVISPGKRTDVDSLKRYKKYVIEFKVSSEGQYFINIS